MKKIGAIYIRVSTDKQEELSPDAQRRLLKEYAERNNISIPTEYIFQDNGISGRKADKRPDFQRMIGLAKSKEHPIDCIIVWKFSRFARNQEESILYKSLLKKNDVDVLSVSENTTGEFGSLIERIIEWMDEYYSIRLSEEVLRGMTESAMRGNFLAPAPIGYKTVGNGNPPVIDDTTKIIPLTMKKLFYEGKSSRFIAAYCNDHGWLTKRGNQYEARDVDYILMNPFYAGILRWNYTDRGRKLKPEDDVIYATGKWEKLWEPEESMYMTTQLLERKKNYGGTRAKRDVGACKHWLSGILHCSSCGKTLSLGGGKRNKGFQCWNYAKGKCPTSHYISVESIVAYVIDGLKDFLHSDTLSYEVISTQNPNTAIQIEDLQKQLTRIDNREKRAKAAYLDGIDSKEEYKQNKEMFAKERETISLQIQKLSAENHSFSQEELDELLIKNLSDVISILENPDIDYEEKGTAIRSVVDYIIFNRNTTSLEFSLKLHI